MKRINNKGYMLVEIILAFSIAFVLIYFVMNLIIKLKNKNDDLLVETLIRTDQTIITNKLMSYAIEEEKEFKCDLLKDGITDNSVKYNDDMIDIVSKYAKIDKSNVSCSTDLGKVSIRIPINVEQMKDEDFDVIIDYKYDIGDMTPPTCSLTVDGTTIIATYADNEGGSGIQYYGFNSDKTGENEDTKAITGVETYIFYVVDKAKNDCSCSVDVKSTVSEPKYEYPGKVKRGSCTCTLTNVSNSQPGSPSTTSGTCNYSTRTCTCPNFYGYPSHNCRLECPQGSETTDSGGCRKKVGTSYKCKENGYSKINDSYCYKVIN